MAFRYPTPRVIRFTTGDMSDPQTAADAREREIPETVFQEPQTLILDLSGKLFSPAALVEMVVPLARRVKGGMYGEARLVVASSDDATRQIVSLLSMSNELAVFVSTSTDPDDVARAEPAGDITAGERNALDEIGHLGGQTTAALLATVVGVEANAMMNRLVNLEKKGYVYRFKRDRRAGDLFVDPRQRPDTQPVGSIPTDANLQREALLRAGITFDPYAGHTDLTREEAEELAGRPSSE